MNTAGGSLSEKTTFRQIVRLLQPSWLSGAICVLAGLAVVVGVISLTQYRASWLGQGLLSWSSLAPNNSYTAAFDTFYNNATFQSAAGVLANAALWAFAGLCIYCLAYGVYDMFWHVRSFKDELYYVHVRRRQVIYDAALRAGARVLTLGTWLAYVLVCIHTIVPLVVTAGHVVAVEPLSVYGLMLACSSFAVLTIALHLHVIFCRLALLRPRVFGNG